MVTVRAYGPFPPDHQVYSTSDWICFRYWRSRGFNCRQFALAADWARRCAPSWLGE